MLQKIFMTAVSAFVCLVASAQDFASVRAMAAIEGTVIAEGVSIEGVIVSDWRSTNLEQNTIVAYDKTDISDTYRTAYIQSLDGSMGFKLKFESIYDSRFDFGSRVKIDLGGLMVVKETDPDRYTVKGLTKDNVTLVSEGTEVPVKKRTISELEDEDIYTWVTLTDVEFGVKRGPVVDMMEKSSRFDSWASMLHDSSGGVIYLIANSACSWSSDPVPAGSGTVTGILTHCQMRRYGRSLGPYSIRPMDSSGISCGGESLCRKLDLLPEGPLRLRTDAASWYTFDGEQMTGYKGHVFETSTLGLDGERLLVAMSFSAGNGNISQAYSFPVFWRVQWSSDGIEWRDAFGENAVLRSVPYQDAYIRNVGQRRLNMDAGAGPTQHAFILPGEALGKERLLLRLVPASDVIAELPEDPFASTAIGKVLSWSLDSFSFNVESFVMNLIK